VGHSSSPSAQAGGAPLAHVREDGPPPRYRIRSADGVVRLRGVLGMDDAGAIWRELGEAGKGAEQLDFDLSGVESIDAGIVALVSQRRAELIGRGVGCEITGGDDAMRELVELYGGRAKPAPPERREVEGLVAQVGRMTLSVGHGLANMIEFVGAMVAALGAIARRPRSANLREVLPLVEKAGVDAIPIVLLINFLVGAVMGFQSAKQLANYGASIFVADLVGLSVTRELAPLMTAIIVCGRTGAAYAAELGTMKVSEEIDALRALGLTPMGYLVFPRTLALLISVPVLTLLADIVGVFGGAMVAWGHMDVGPTAFLGEMRGAVSASDVISGLIKSVAYSVAIALIACQQGFATSGGAEGVGRRTTSTVVMGLFALVVIDTVLTVLFNFLRQ
jgi:phospholipid/cholesterol/gamma-HCH transport system permease protein